MITKRNGNGQTECYGCKEKGKFALTWDSWLYNYNNEPYCFNCLMEELERLNKENKKLKNNWKSLKKWLKFRIDATTRDISRVLYKSILTNVKEIEKSDK